MDKLKEREFIGTALGLLLVLGQSGGPVTTETIEEGASAGTGVLSQFSSLDGTQLLALAIIIAAFSLSRGLAKLNGKEKEGGA